MRSQVPVLRVALFFLTLFGKNTLSSAFQDGKILFHKKVGARYTKLSERSGEFDRRIVDRTHSIQRSTSKCKTFPGDPSWPNDNQWRLVNHTTDGALIKTIPIEAPCYAGPLYDADECAYITAEWFNSSLHMADPTSMMSPLWQGRTCEPPSIFASPTNCTIGGYPAYAINATNVAQIQAGVIFARSAGIRLVIKNTGHDFSGKSGGAGALSIWTHHLKDIDFLPNYVEDGGSEYKGPAFKAGSGVQAFEIYEAADARGLMVVGGEGRTVGVMGGYILGGGHSPLSSILGIAADHVLSLEVVLESGLFVTASATQNPDLFWALRGGGGSTFGVMTSVTVKAYPTLSVTATQFAFGVDGNVTYDAFWAGVRAYFNHFIEFPEAGTYAYFFIIPGDAPLFLMEPFFAPNMSITDTEALLQPWLDELAALDIIVEPTYTSYPTFYSAWTAQFPQERVGEDDAILGSRLFPRSNWLNETLLNATFSAYKDSVDQGLITINFNIAPLLSPSNFPNSVNPAWRNTVLHSIQTALFAENATKEEILETRALLTEGQAAWKEVSLGAGSYLGESDREEVDFEQSFYGDYYPRLLEIKRSVDPEDVFWVKTGVGSEGWHVVTEDVLDDENGKLCRVGE